MSEVKQCRYLETLRGKTYTFPLGWGDWKSKKKIGGINNTNNV